MVLPSGDHAPLCACHWLRPFVTRCGVPLGMGIPLGPGRKGRNQRFIPKWLTASVYSNFVRSRDFSLDEALLVTSRHGPDLVALDDALSALSAMDERKGRVVELRFFGGLSVDETAAVLGVSSDTVLRDWKMAKVWLLRETKRGKS